MTGSYTSLREDEKLSVFCNNPRFDLQLNSVDPEDFLETDDDAVPIYPDVQQLFSDDPEYHDMTSELYECLDDVLDEITSFSEVNDQKKVAGNKFV